MDKIFPEQKNADENSSAHAAVETKRSDAPSTTTGTKTKKAPTLLVHSVSPPNDEPLCEEDSLALKKLFKQRGVEAAIEPLFGPDAPAWTSHKLLECTR